MTDTTPTPEEVDPELQPLTGTQTLAAISVTFALMAAGVVIVRKSKQIVRMLVS